NLYQKAMNVRWSLMWLALSIYFYYYFNHKKQFFSFFKESFQQGCILLSVVVAFVAIWAILDFNSFWMNFHYVFFDNDLFLLDPNISIMINMFPERFFFDMVAMIIFTFLFVVAIMYLIIHYLYRREVNRFVEEV
ncbi:MAG: DUF1461 domain-containing protein, partial [Solobacterium sp.]|nr:DUF1461 domain-containing protein [Solobacterium sp.]